MLSHRAYRGQVYCLTDWQMSWVPESYLLPETREGYWQQHGGRPADLPEAPSPSSGHQGGKKDDKAKQRAQRSRQQLEAAATAAAAVPEPMAAAAAAAAAATPACDRGRTRQQTRRLWTAQPAGSQ